MKIIKDKKMLIIFGIIVLAFFGIFAKMNYSVDTYLLFASKDFNYLNEYIRSGRLLTALLFKVLQVLRFSPEAMYIVSFIIGIICATLAIYILNKVLNKYINNKIICALISALIVINPFIIELWLFIEMGIMMLSILACVLAYKEFDSFIESRSKKKIIYCILFVLLAVFCYQGTLGLFIALCTISIIKHSSDFKSFFINTILSVICYAIPTVINFVVVLLIGNSRVRSRA